MRVALIDVDGHNGFPNLALMKLSAYHKQKGDLVEWYDGMFGGHYDVCYMSKVFTFTDDFAYMVMADKVVRGGTGYDITSVLPKDVEYMQPDYSIYCNIDARHSYGFLTRGCPNKCKWCVVPRKEGRVRPYMDCDEVAMNGKRPYMVLMDNNILASDYGLSQIEKIVERKYHIDFNQAMDARLVTPEVAQLLAKVKWIKRMRFGCDTPAQVEHCRRAIDLCRQQGYNGEFFLYTMLHGTIEECYDRCSAFRSDKKVLVHCQPMLDLNNKEQNIPQWQKDMARWGNRKEIYRTIDFKEYRPRKNFICKLYFNEL